MSIIYVLIPLAIIIVAVALGIFFWAVRSNQFEDLERQGYSILFDDDLPEEQRQKPPASSATAKAKDTDTAVPPNE
ncbi:MAG: cbb3-type cytochrome oxidase assembly protein CcoS [Alteromonadaceae bacterium]|nr:cbb3-type cytochrome oxidase assembly protein CcoS [Alteromonadaceae bacterium]